MPQAHAQDWKLAAQATEQVDADSRILWRAGARGNNDPLGMHSSDFFDRNLIIPAYDDVLPQLAQILHQVVGKGVVVIKDEDHS